MIKGRIFNVKKSEVKYLGDGVFEQTTKNLNLTESVAPNFITLTNDQTDYSVEFEFKKKVANSFYYTITNKFNSRKVKLSFKPNEMKFVLVGD